MAFELWTPNDLYELRRDPRLDPEPSWFLDEFFTETYYSDDDEIRIGELPTPYRRLAPFVLPSEQGKPIFARKGESVQAISPAYIKPKDPVRPEDARNVLPSEIFANNGQRPSLAARFDQRVAEVTQFHLRAIKMTQIWMAARAILDGRITIQYQRDQGAAHPEVILDFGRDAGHTIVLNTEYWDDPDYDIISDLTEWSNTMYNAKFGGRPTKLVVGAAVAPYITKNKGILALLNTQIRGAEDTTMRRGLFNIDQPMSYIATLGGIGQSIEIWTYKDVIESNDGSMVDLMHPKDVLLMAPGVRGVRAFGAIYDTKALAATDGKMAIDIFGKMWETDDPGEIYIMHQSAPLMFPLYPNRTLKARVLA